MLTPEFWRKLDDHCLSSKDRLMMNWNWENSSLLGYSVGFGMSPRQFNELLMPRLEVVDVPVRVALDLAGGSQGIAMLELIREGYVAMGLTADHQVFKDRDSNEPRAHLKSVDLTTEEGWKTISDWKEEHTPEGLSLILHRPGDALQFLPEESYTGFLELCLDLLAPNGLLVAQLPRGLLKSPNSFPVQPFKDASIRKLEFCMEDNLRIATFALNCLNNAAMPWVMVEKAA